MSSPKPDRDRRAVAALIVILLVILVPLGYYMGTLISATDSTNGCQCFDADVAQLASRELGTGLMNGTLANQTAVNGTIPSYAQVITQNSTIVFHSSNISLVVFAYPNFEAGYLLNT